MGWALFFAGASGDEWRAAQGGVFVRQHSGSKGVVLFLVEECVCVRALIAGLTLVIGTE